MGWRSGECLPAPPDTLPGAVQSGTRPRFEKGLFQIERYTLLIRDLADLEVKIAPEVVAVQGMNVGLPGDCQHHPRASPDGSVRISRLQRQLVHPEAERSRVARRRVRRFTLLQGKRPLRALQRDS